MGARYLGPVVGEVLLKLLYDINSSIQDLAVLCMGSQVDKVPVELLEGEDGCLGSLVCQLLVKLLEDEDGGVQCLAVRCPGVLVGEDPPELL